MRELERILHVPVIHGFPRKPGWLKSHTRTVEEGPVPWFVSTRHPDSCRDLHRFYSRFTKGSLPVRTWNPSPSKGTCPGAAGLTKGVNPKARPSIRREMAMEPRVLRSRTGRCEVAGTRRAVQRKRKGRGIRRGATRAAKTFDEMDLVVDPETKKPLEIFVQLEQQAVEEARKKSEQVRARSPNAI